MMPPSAGLPTGLSTRPEGVIRIGNAESPEGLRETQIPFHGSFTGIGKGHQSFSIPFCAIISPLADGRYQVCLYGKCMYVETVGR